MKNPLVSPSSANRLRCLRLMTFFAGTAWATATWGETVFLADFEDAAPPAPAPGWQATSGLFGAAAGAFYHRTAEGPMAQGNVSEIGLDLNTVDGWFIVATFDIGGPFPTTDPLSLQFTGDFLSSNGLDGGNVLFRIESLDSLGGAAITHITFNGPASDTEYTQLGGLLSEGLAGQEPFVPGEGLDFDYDAPDYRVVIGINDPNFGTAAANYWVRYDNLRIEFLNDPEANDLIISEFLASNNNDLEDENGGDADWIELFNGTDEPVNLEGWSLTDDAAQPAQWVFPNVTIQPNAYLIVFATSKDRRDPAGKLHTNFNLSRSGEYLGLYRPDGTLQYDFGAAFPRQIADVSYGLKDGVQGYFKQTTPGRSNSDNQPSLGPAIDEIGHSPRVPTEIEPIVVTALMDDDSGPLPASVTLHYRINFGSEMTVPMNDAGEDQDVTEDDQLYTGTIPASAYTAGDMVRYYVTATDDGVTFRRPIFAYPEGAPEYSGTRVSGGEPDTDLPVLYWFIEDPEAANDLDRSGTRCSLFYDGLFYDNVFVRIRGGSVTLIDKKSYKFDFNGGYLFRLHPDQEPVEEINVNSTNLDKSFLRQQLAFETFEAAGVDASRAFNARVEQNGVFFSVATIIEQVDFRLLKRKGLDRDGALYKFAPADGFNPITSTTFGVGKHTREDEDRSDLQALITGLQLPPNERRTFLYDNINIPAVLNYLAVTCILHDRDHLAKNFYLYRDTEGDREWQFIPWDKDLTFGRNYVEQLDGMLYQSIFTDIMQADNDTVDGNNVGAPSHPLYGDFDRLRVDAIYNRLIDALYRVPEIRAMYLRRLRTVMDAYLQSPGTPVEERFFEKRIAELQLQIAGDAELDNARWPFNWPGGFSEDLTYTEGIAQITDDYLPRRRVHLYEHHLEGSTFAFPAGVPDAPAGIPLAQPASVPMAFGLIDGNPASGNQDEEFISVTNPNDFAVDLSDWQLVSAVDFTFPDGTIVPAGGTIHIARDSGVFRQRATAPTGGQGLLVVGGYDGQISSRGERLQLLDASGSLVAEQMTPMNPTDNQRFLRITEISFAPLAPEDGSPYEAADFEFVELTNIGDVALDLSGVTVGSGITFVFAGSDITTLAPGETVLIVRNEQALKSRYGDDLPVAGEYSGKLDNAGDSIQLRDENGENILNFAYDDEWFPRAEIIGQSFVILDPTGSEDDWDKAASWGLSAAPGATPGDAVVAPGLTFSAWVFDHFTPQERANPAVSGATNDPDGDGFDNFIEYAFGLSPTSADSPGKHLPMAEGGTPLTISYRRPAAPLDIVYTIGISSDLENWTYTLEAAAQTGPPVDNGDGSVTVTISAPGTPATRQFAVVQVSR